MKLVSLICFLPYLKSNLNLFNSCKEHSYFMQNFAVLVHSGSRHEVSYPSGVSHCLERLGFAGSSMFKTRDDVMQAVEKLGGICDCQSSRYHYFLLTFCSLLCDSLKNYYASSGFQTFLKFRLCGPQRFISMQNLKIWRAKKKKRSSRPQMSNQALFNHIIYQKSATSSQSPWNCFANPKRTAVPSLRITDLKNRFMWCVVFSANSYFTQVTVRPILIT